MDCYRSNWSKPAPEMWSDEISFSNIFTVVGIANANSTSRYELA